MTVKVKFEENDAEPQFGEFASGGSPSDTQALEPWRLEQNDASLQKTLRSWHSSLPLAAFQPQGEVQEEGVPPGFVHRADAEESDRHLQVAPTITLITKYKIQVVLPRPPRPL